MKVIALNLDIKRVETSGSILNRLKRAMGFSLILVEQKRHFISQNAER